MPKKKHRAPVISRRAHEHALRMQDMHAQGIAFQSHGNGVTNGMQALHDWLVDSRLKAQRMRSELYADAPETFHVGWDEGQKWINEAIAELDTQIRDRRGERAVTDHDAEASPAPAD